MKKIDCVQGTPEWFAIRCGIPTASNFDKIITTKGDPSKQRTKYLWQLAGEYVAGKSDETYQNAAMIRGVEIEPEARTYYEITNGVEVEKVGFCLAEGGYGASPDGFVWWDFCSYYPNIKPFVIRARRDEVFIKKLSIELEIFVQELKSVVAKLKEK